MKYESIDDIYSANAKIRAGLEMVLGGVSPEEAAQVPDADNWSIQQIVEHLALVGGGTARICSKLVDGARAANNPADGSFSLSSEFNHRSEMAAAAKIQAPERVQPGGMLSIPESMQKLAESQPTVDSLKD